MKIRNGGARVAFYSIAAASVVGCQVTGEEFPDTEPPQCVVAFVLRSLWSRGCWLRVVALIRWTRLQFNAA